MEKVSWSTRICIQLIKIPDPMQRPIIKNIFETGIKSIDGLLTLEWGRGSEFLQDPELEKVPWWECSQEIVSQILMW